MIIKDCGDVCPFCEQELPKIGPVLAIGIEGVEMNKIEIGDIVSVSFHNSKFTLIDYAEVLHMPNATGDSWQFKELGTRDIYYISEGCTIRKAKGE